MDYFQYYGVDIIAALCCVAQVILLGEKRNVGWLVGAVGCVLWTVFGLMSESLGVIVMNSFLIIINTYYFMQKPSLEERV